MATYKAVPCENLCSYVNLLFNDGITYELSTSSFLFKQSKLLQSIDIDEDNTIPILCSSTYVLDENKRQSTVFTENVDGTAVTSDAGLQAHTFLFDNKTDLSFMFTLLPNKFLEVCKFLDIICYENTDNAFSKEFITYIMTNIKEEINIIHYFMQNEIKCILLYNDNKHLVNFCTPEFYFLYLIEYKEEVIKYNRIDIYNLSHDKSEYYRYIHKYDNHLTFIVKETKEYNDYITKISNKLNEECIKPNNFKKIKKLVEQGASCYTTLCYASFSSNTFEVIKYLIEHGADINMQDTVGNILLHNASRFNNLELVKYLVERGANVNLQNNYGYTALHFASSQPNNIETIKYLVEHGADINLQNGYSKTALHIALNQSNNEEVINYLKQFI